MLAKLKHLFPNLVNIDGGKLMGWAFFAIFAWIAVLGSALDWFGAMGWVDIR